MKAIRQKHVKRMEPPQLGLCEDSTQALTGVSLNVESEEIRFDDTKNKRRKERQCHDDP